MQSQPYKTSQNLSSKNLTDLLFVNYNQDFLDFKNLNIQDFPKLQDFQIYLANQSESFLIENYFYLQTLEKDLEQYICLYNNVKNYFKSIKSIFKDILVQKLS